MRISRVRGLCLVIAGAIAINTAFVMPAQAETTTGSIAGQITDSTGAPAPNVNVFASRDDGTSIAYVNTDSTGHYMATGLTPGKFTLQFTTIWGGIRNYDGTVEVIAGGQTVVNYALPATGGLAGRLTRQDGSGAAGFQVRTGWHRHSTTTDADGNWRFDRVFAVADNWVQFQSWQERVVQYAYGKLDIDTADQIAVLPGETTTVNDVLLPTGSVRVTATNSVTGAPVTNFFAHIRTVGAPSQDGVALLTGVPIGTHDLTVSAPGYVDWDVKSVTVVANEQVNVEVKLVPEARITVSVVDAANGQPLAGVCVAAISPARIPTEGCGPTSDENGRVTVDYLAAGAYKLLAVPTDAPGYGAQWVGANGGTGRQHLAVTINVQAGQTAAGPVIRMDTAGTITGTVTKADGSRPQRDGALVGLLPVMRNDFNESTPATVRTDENDRYTIGFVGPYDWELFFGEVNEAAQWSGGVANPLFATAVRVRAGQTSMYDFRFRAAVRVTLVITGMPLNPGYFSSARNAFTGYEMAKKSDWSNTTNQVTLLLVGPQFAKFQVQGRWFGGADFAHARSFWIPPSGSKTIELAY